MVTTTLDVSVLTYRNRVVIRYYTDDAEAYKGTILAANIGNYKHLPDTVRGMAYAYLVMHDTGFGVDVEPVARPEGASTQES